MQQVAAVRSLKQAVCGSMTPPHTRLRGLFLGRSDPINSKIAALRYQARGYRDPEYFKLKIFQRCSLTDNPWAANRAVITEL